MYIHMTCSLSLAKKEMAGTLREGCATLVSCGASITNLFKVVSPYKIFGFKMNVL